MSIAFPPSDDSPADQITFPYRLLTFILLYNLIESGKVMLGSTWKKVTDNDVLKDSERKSQLTGFIGL
jgi:hypothetical protein